MRHGGMLQQQADAHKMAQEQEAREQAANAFAVEQAAMEQPTSNPFGNAEHHAPPPPPPHARPAPVVKEEPVEEAEAPVVKEEPRDASDMEGSEGHKTPVEGDGPEVTI